MPKAKQIVTNNYELPIYLFHQGTNYRTYEFMGAHFVVENGESGVRFCVWAGKASQVSVVGDFNDWDKSKNPMVKLSDNGVWSVFIKGLKNYDTYKFAIKSQNNRWQLKADPYAYHTETPPKTGSKTYQFADYKWQATDYENNRKNYSPYTSPINIYEVNLASWKKNENGGYYTYNQLCDELVPYVKEMGYTHVEFMPVTEYPFDGSWGYQVTGYYAVSSRFGIPDDFKRLIDEFHKNNIGVIIDWVPAHFPKDDFGLAEFDGSYLYEDSNPFRREHKGWGTLVFDYGKNEVQSFLVSSALFFFENYHIDGIRVDAVASMLYLDYDRKDGEWQQNSQGTNINLEAVSFLQKLNSAVFENYPYALMVAEESTAYPMVTMPVSMGGLGFNYKWNMGWMNDVLSYSKVDPMFRGNDHNKLTFSMMYAFSENYILPISHDEVVHGKCSLIQKMPGDYETRFANVRAFMGYMMAHPGKKLIFMGQEFCQMKEWAYKEGLEFFMLDYPMHKMVQKFFKDLNNFYKNNDSLYSIEKSWDGFEWVIADDNNNNTLVFVRKGLSNQQLLVIINFSGLDHKGYRIGVDSGKYKVVLNSDDKVYGGEGKLKKTLFTSTKKASHGKNSSIVIDIPKMSCLYLEKV